MTYCIAIFEYIINFNNAVRQKNMNKHVEKQNLLDSIGIIYEQSKNSKLEDAFFSKIDKELSILSEYFNTSKIQAFLIALVYVFNYIGVSVGLTDLIKYLACNPVKLLMYKSDFDVLYQNGIFEKEITRRELRIAGANEQFYINQEITEAILENKSLPQVKPRKINDIYDLLNELFKLGDERFNEIISSTILFNRINNLINSNLNFPLIRLVHNFDVKIAEKYLFLFLVKEAMLGYESIDLDDFAYSIFDSSLNELRFKHEFTSGENILLEKNLVEVKKSNCIKGIELALTDNSYYLISKNEINIVLIKKL